MSTLVNVVICAVQFGFLGLYLWGMIRAARRTPGPPPWPLRLVMEDTGSPKMPFIYVMLAVSVVLFVVLITTAPSQAQQRRQQLDRIEQLLREIRDEVRR
jgi:hypothetical protein